jgi:hypothetical protein
MAVRQYVAVVMSDVRVIAGNDVAEMLETANMLPDDCKLFLRELALVMGSDENASTTFARYVAPTLLPTPRMGRS